MRAVGDSCPGCGAPVLDQLASGLCLRCVAGRISGDSDTSPTTRLPDGYEFIEELGRGGMGIVYLAFQRSLGRYVALKQLGAAWREHPRARDRFLIEARAAARLVHPGIVPVLETGLQDDGTVWYTMEYLEGGDLAQLLQERGRLTWQEALGLLAPVAEAIGAAHREGVIHRDLKPSNILLDVAGVPKVADFGLAWMTGQELKDLTATGELLGTPAYMAPECLAGRARDAAEISGDIYALGAVLFHLVAGRPPFVAEHPIQQLAAIGRDPAPRLNTVSGLGGVPERVVDACAQCLEKKPRDRFSSAGELAAELRACLQGSSRGWRVQPWLRRRRRSLVVGLTAAAVLALGAISFRRYAAAPPEQPATPAEARAIALAVMPAKADAAGEAIALVAGGLQDEIITWLLRLSDIPVIGAASARAADQRTQDPAELRRLLGAGSVVTLRLQRWQDMVRVSAQLVDTGTGRVLWSRTYDRKETNLLNLQTDVATDLAIRLSGSVSAKAADATRGASSAMPEAQRLLDEARRLMRDASAANDQLGEAERSLRRAVAIDPEFALAYATLAEAHLLLYHWGTDRSETRLAAALDAAQAALRLNPRLPEAEVALGNYYYRGSRDYATARPHFERAHELAPNKPDALEGLGYLVRRMGDFGAASAYLQAALKLDPLNPVLAYNVADTEFRRHAFDRAATLLDESLRLMPGHVALLKLKGDLYAGWRGDLKPMRDELATRPAGLPTPELFVFDQVEARLLAGQPAAALEFFRGSKFGLLDAQSVYLTRAGYDAMLLLYAGRREEARVAAEAELPGLGAELARRPNDARLLLHAAQLSAIAGKMTEATRLFERTITPGDLAAVDAFDRGYFLRCGAILFAAAGNTSHSRELLNELERVPSQYTAAVLRLHPMLKPVFADSL